MLTSTDPEVEAEAEVEAEIFSTVVMGMISAAELWLSSDVCESKELSAGVSC